MPPESAASNVTCFTTTISKAQAVTLVDSETFIATISVSTFRNAQAVDVINEDSLGERVALRLHNLKPMKPRIVSISVVMQTLRRIPT